MDNKRDWRKEEVPKKRNEERRKKCRQFRRKD